MALDVGRLKGKRAVVTGGSRGIGRAIAQRFVEEGAQVVIGARNTPVDDTSGGAQFVRADVSKAADVQHLIRPAVVRMGGLDILVNNAGVEIEKTVEDTSEAEWDRLIDINLKGVFLCCKYAIAPMRESGGGSIINMGSYSGFLADPELAAYCASKGGVQALSRAVAVDHGKDGIRSNVICPGWIRTEMMAQYLGSQSETTDVERALLAEHPGGRL